MAEQIITLSDDQVALLLSNLSNSVLYHRALCDKKVDDPNRRLKPLTELAVSVLRQLPLGKDEVPKEPVTIRYYDLQSTVDEVKAQFGF